MPTEADLVRGGYLRIEKRVYIYHGHHGGHRVPSNYNEVFTAIDIVGKPTTAEGLRCRDVTKVYQAYFERPLTIDSLNVIAKATMDGDS